MSETIEAPAPDTAPTPDPVDDLRAAIGAAFDEHAEPDAAPQRDERGRFAGREVPEGAEPAAPEPKAEAAPAELPPLPPPATLAADDVSRWATLPREHQEWIAAREAKAQETTKAFEPINEVLTKYSPLFAARGVPPAQAIAALFEAQHMLQTRPNDAIRALAREFGATLPTAEAHPSNDNDQWNALVQEVQQLRAAVAESQQATAQERRIALETQIRDFASNPAHRHFPIVRPYMGALMTADPELDMARAYEMACRAHPSVSKALADEEAKAAIAARTKAANEARAKQVSVRGGAPPVAGNGAAPDSLRGTLVAAWDGALH